MKRYAIALLLTGAATVHAQSCAASLAGNYSASTTAAIDQLFTSADKLRAGDSAAARSILQGMSTSVENLKTSSDCFRARADSEHKVCLANVTTLEKRIGDLSQEEDRSKKRLADLDAKIAAADKNRNLTAKEIERLQGELRKTNDRLRERQRKMNELKTWWWVPGYGQYLAVRTLVDEDIQQSRNLQGTIGDQMRQLNSNQASMQAIRRTRAELDGQWQAMQRTLRDLRNMRDASQKQVGSLKVSLVYLQNSGLFWGKMRQVLQINVESSLKMVTEIQSMLGEKTKTPVFDNPDAEPVLMDLKASLISFGSTVDSGRSFLTMDRTALCGGPGR